MAKGSIIYINSNKPGDWVRAAKGSKLYELIEEKAAPEIVQACYKETEAEFRKWFSAEFIKKYYSEIPK
jgi:Leu/Phe-tRNA-protein transferase